MTIQWHDAALSIMEGLDCPRSLTVAIMLRYEDWDGLVALSADPSHYCTAESYWRAAQATDLLRKCPDLPGGPSDADREAAATEKWWWAERECKRTNDRLNHLADLASEFLLNEDEARVWGVLLRARKVMARIMGSGPPSPHGRFGPGATVSDVSRMTLTPDKMSSGLTLTPSALGYLFPWMGTRWGQAHAALGLTPTFTGGNVYFTVPKTAKIKRACAKEPSLNSYYQLGYGGYLQRKLGAFFGYRWSGAQEIHRQVACKSSRDGSFATIDLTSASDCNSTALVKLLTPYAWHCAMSDLRCSHTLVPTGDGLRRVYLEKFSSMGNGFTFELETCVFTSLCMGLYPDLIPGVTLFVYGDDIIVPTECAEGVIAILKYCGFTPNMAKTFVSGPFRESCGGDFWDGVPVRPYSLKGIPCEPQHWIAFANGVRRSCRANDEPSSQRFPSLRRAWFRLLDSLPSAIRRCRGPEELGDLLVHDEPERWYSRTKESRRYFRVYRPVPVKVRFSGYAYEIQFAAVLYGLRLGGPSNGTEHQRWMVPRDGVRGYKLGWVQRS